MQLLWPIYSYGLWSYGFQEGLDSLLSVVYGVMAYIVMAHKVMAYIVMAYMIIVYIVMAFRKGSILSCRSSMEFC